MWVMPVKEDNFAVLRKVARRAPLNYIYLRVPYSDTFGIGVHSGILSYLAL
jgi:hypothetical protein